MDKLMDITICGWNVVLTCKRKTSPKTGTESLSHQANDLITEERILALKKRINEQNKLLDRRYQSVPSDQVYGYAKTKEYSSLYQPEDKKLSLANQRASELYNLKEQLKPQK